jgi:site-specific DNA-methyltransferase (adenine-specific)
MTVTLLQGDCLDFLRNTGDKSVDLVFYDPPYNIGKDYGEYKDKLPPEEYDKWMREIAFHAERVARRGVVVYIGGKLTALFGDIYPQAHLIIVWKRAAGVFSGNYMLQYHSMYSTAKPVIKCKDLWDDVRLPGEGYFFRETRYDHPGLTGLALTEKVLHHFTLEGETVLDMFAGVGTTAVACVKNNRHFIGSELSPKYYEVAQCRVAQAQPTNE